MQYLDAIHPVYLIAVAGLSLGFLAMLARLDRASALADRELSEIDRNAAAELYRRAAAEKRETAKTLKAYLAALEERDQQPTRWERMGIVARNVG